MISDPCLDCKLDNCDETHRDCFFYVKLNESKQRWYKKLKGNSERYAEYLKKVNNRRRALYYESPENRKKRNASARKWQKEHPEGTRIISRRSHNKHKEKRLAQHREYMKKRRKIIKLACLHSKSMVFV